MDKSHHRQLRRESQRYKPGVFTGSAIVFSATVLLCAGLYLSVETLDLRFPFGFVLWASAQVLVAAGILQCFFIVHEAGHHTLFESRTASAVAGSAASIFCFIPFFPWQFIHRKHHRWTGWKDRDPTTAKAIPRKLAGWERAVIDFAWKYWLPFFCPIYALDNFWNLPRLVRLTSRRRERARFVLSMGLIVASWALILWLVPVTVVLYVYGPAFFLVLLVADPLMLSQHSHIHQEQAHDEEVSPFPLYAQDMFTRTLTLPNWVSRYVFFGFDRHEAHHLLPHVPGCHLPKLEITTPNDIHWRTWIRLAKSIPGHQLVFLTREETGVWL